MNNSNIDEIIKGCKKNDRNCQKLLFELFSKKMMGVCLRYCYNYETARDMVQDGFVKVYTKINDFKGDSAVQTWMTRIFINTCLSHINKLENKSIHLDINDLNIQYTTENSIGNEEVVENSIKNLPVTAVLEYINQLPEKYKIVLNMYSIDGYSHQQIAEALDIQIGSSKSRLSRARQLLIDLIKEKEN